MLLSTQQIAFRYIFTDNSRLSKARKYILGVFPWSLAFDGQKVIEKLLEAGIVEEKSVKRGLNGKIIRVFFREMPSQEKVEIACLGMDGMNKIDDKIRKGLL